MPRMEPITIMPCPVETMIADPNLPVLLDEYAAAGGIDEIGTPSAQFDMYRTLERSGILHPICAFRAGEMVGFLILLVSVMPHYGNKVGSSESYFVTAKARRYGVGMQLLTYAEDYARTLGATAMLISTPAGGALEKVMSRKSGYRPTNTVFCKGLS